MSFQFYQHIIDDKADNISTSGGSSTLAKSGCHNYRCSASIRAENRRHRGAFVQPPAMATLLRVCEAC